MGRPAKRNYGATVFFPKSKDMVPYLLSLGLLLKVQTKFSKCHKNHKKCESMVPLGDRRLFGTHKNI
jgi:hypothetical protein